MPGYAVAEVLEKRATGFLYPLHRHARERLVAVEEERLTPS